MNFEHSEDRRMLADTLDRFISEQYGFEKRDQISKSALGYSPDLWQQFAGLGTIGALFDEIHGGYGGSGFDIAVVFEALGKGLVVEPFSNALLVGNALAAIGTDAQKEVLAGIIEGNTLASFAHAEPNAFHELGHVEMRAHRNADGWRLDGAKAVVQQGENADIFLVSARTAGNPTDTTGISLFLVPADAPGVTVRGYANIDGGRSAELTLQDVALEQAALVGAEGEAFPTLEELTARGIVAVCAEALGAMEAAKAATLEYLSTRKQFGVAIGSFQALQHRMANMLLEIEQVRSAVINAAAALDADRITRERAVSAAKYTVGRIGALVAEESIQLHGAIGMTWELPLSHFAKRLVMIDHQFGDMDYHLDRYIALNQQA